MIGGLLGVGSLTKLIRLIPGLSSNIIDSLRRATSRSTLPVAL